MHLINTTQLASPGARGSVVGIGDPSANSNLVQSTGLQNGGMGIVSLGSPASQISLDVISKNGVDTSSLSPVPYVFGRGRKCSAALEKVVERRQRRMIKNRESAARSRARKQVNWVIEPLYFFSPLSYKILFLSMYRFKLIYVDSSCLKSF